MKISIILSVTILIAVTICLYYSDVFGQFSILELKSMAVKDESLIVPGVGGAGILIDAPENELVLLKGKPTKITQTVSHDFFSSVIKIKSAISLPFNYLYVYNNPLRIIGLLHNKVSFIVLVDYSGVLIDGTSIAKGVMAILFYYGNEGMQCIREVWGSIYLYSSRGVAFVDENNDDSVDGIIIFKSALHQ